MLADRRPRGGARRQDKITFLARQKKLPGQFQRGGTIPQTRFKHISHQASPKYGNKPQQNAHAMQPKLTGECKLYVFGLITSGQIIDIRKRGQGKFSSDSFLGGIKDKENYLPPLQLVLVILTLIPRSAICSKKLFEANT